jgi:hypothetical protein
MGEGLVSGQLNRSRDVETVKAARLWRRHIGHHAVLGTEVEACR